MNKAKSSSLAYFWWGGRIRTDPFIAILTIYQCIFQKQWCQGIKAVWVLLWSEPQDSVVFSKRKFCWISALRVGILQVFWLCLSFRDSCGLGWGAPSPLALPGAFGSTNPRHLTSSHPFQCRGNGRASPGYLVLQPNDVQGVPQSRDQIQLPEGEIKGASLLFPILDLAKIAAD